MRVTKPKGLGSKYTDPHTKWGGGKVLVQGATLSCPRGHGELLQNIMGPAHRVPYYLGREVEAQHQDVNCCEVHLRVAMAVCGAAQHATPCSTAQHPCALQHNATTGIKYT